MLRLVTAGESHGPALVVSADGFPAGVPIGLEDVARELRRRQAGYGRGPRAAGTVERVSIIAGVSGGRTTGAPVALILDNPAPEGGAGHTPGVPPGRGSRVPRPGHADLAAAAKYGTIHFWPAVERASARETAARVAGAVVARNLLEALGVRVGSHVTAIGGVTSRSGAPAAAARRASRDWTRLLARAEQSPVRCASATASGAMVSAIDRASACGDTLGGVFEVVAIGCPPGLGSFGQWDRRLDARLAAAVMSVPSVKGVEIGLGFGGTRRSGRAAHDPLLPVGDPSAADGPWIARVSTSAPLGAGRAGNRAGGIEGGISNGQPLVVRGAVKPVPTLTPGLASVDLGTGQPAPAPAVRGDRCVVPAAGVVAEAMVAWVLAEAVLERFGGDTLQGVLTAAARAGDGSGSGGEGGDS